MLISVTSIIPFAQTIYAQENYASSNVENDSEISFEDGTIKEIYTNDPYQRKLIVNDVNGKHIVTMSHLTKEITVHSRWRKA